MKNQSNFSVKSHLSASITASSNESSCPLRKLCPESVLVMPFHILAVTDFYAHIIFVPSTLFIAIPLKLNQWYISWLKPWDRPSSFFSLSSGEMNICFVDRFLTFWWNLFPDNQLKRRKWDRMEVVNQSLNFKDLQWVFWESYMICSF